MIRGFTLLAAAEASVAARRLAKASGFYAGAALLVLLSLVFALLALRDWLLASLTPVEANLAVAGGILVAGMGLFGAAVAIRYARPRTTTLQTAGLLLAPSALSVTRKMPLGTLALAAVIAAGAWLGRSVAKSD